VIFWTKNPACNLGFWLKGSRFKGSEVDFTATLTNEINGKEKKRDGINPEPLNPDRPNVQFKGNNAVYKALRSILLDL
jgi:hypothetical protein